MILVDVVYWLNKVFLCVCRMMYKHRYVDQFNICLRFKFSTKAFACSFSEVSNLEKKNINLINFKAIKCGKS